MQYSIWVLQFSVKFYSCQICHEPLSLVTTFRHFGDYLPPVTCQPVRCGTKLAGRLDLSAAPSSRHLVQRTTRQLRPLELVPPLPTPVKRRGATLGVVGSSAAVRRAAPMSTRLATFDAEALGPALLPGLQGLDYWLGGVSAAETGL